MSKTDIDQSSGEVHASPLEISDETLDEYDVSEENRRRIQKAIDYDLSFVTDEFGEELIRKGKPFACEQAYPIRNHFGKADQEIAEILETEFRKFVVLTLVKPDMPHALPGPVDMFWHRFILYTAQYKEFCEEVWGSFEGQPEYRDHYPANPETREGHVNAYYATRDLYLEVFGEPTTYEQASGDTVDIWYGVDDKATCGDSYSGSGSGAEQFDQFADRS